jgi:hypothetical protein
MDAFAALPRAYAWCDSCTGTVRECRCSSLSS